MVLAEDALLGLLFPFWQLLIGIFVLLAIVASVHRLIMRGPSRMTTAMLISGGVVVGLTAIGLLWS
jgi:hypothetical protein